MALVVKDRVKQTTTTTGTGSIVLNGNVSGFQTFAAALTDGDTTYYGIFEPSTNEYEVGLGTWTESTATLARTTVLESSNSGSAVSLTAQAEVFITQPAEKAVYLNSNGDVDLGGNKILFGNLYSTTGDLPSASTYHGMFAHVHGTGKAYYAHAGNWIELVNEDTSGNVSMGGNLTVTGDLTVNGTTTTIDTTNTVVTDSLIELANGTTGTPANDAGLVIERGDSNNAFIGFDESADKFIVGTGSFTGASTGDLTITTGTLVANVEGNVTGNVTGDVTGNADTATALATGRTISLTGAVTGTSAAFDGSGNVSIATTATSDPTITLTGAVTGSGTMTNLGNVSIATTATADPTLTLAGDASGSATFTNLGNATLTVTVADDSHNHIIGNVDGLQTALDAKLASSSYTASDVLTKIKTVDGSGSGLDADLWDGNQFSTYLNQSLTTANAPTFAGATLNGGLNVSGVIEGQGDVSIGGGTGYGYLKGYSTNWNHFIGSRMQVSGNTTSPTISGGHDITFVEYLDSPTSGFKFKNSSSGTYVDVVHIGYDGIFISDGSLREDYDALSGTTPTCNVNSGGAFSLSMSGNTTFTFTSPLSGYSTGFILQLTGNGGTVTWPGSVKWAGGTAPDAPASGETDILVFHTRDGGTNWYGVLASDAAA